MSGVLNTGQKQHHPNSIAKFRGRRGWSIVDCADALGCDEGTVRALEKGEMVFHDGWIERFAIVFRCSRAEILAPSFVARNPGVARKRGTRNLKKGNKRWLGRLVVPKSGDPLVKEVFKLMNEQRRELLDVARRSGVSKSAISMWRYDRQPTVANLRAVVNTLGYDLVLKKRDET